MFEHVPESKNVIYCLVAEKAIQKYNYVPMFVLPASVADIRVSCTDSKTIDAHNHQFFQ